MNKVLCKIICITLLIIFIIPSPDIAYADSEKIGALELYSHYNGDNGTFIIKKENFKIYKIADYYEGKFIYKEEFSMFDNYNSNMASSDIHQLSLNINSYIKENNLEADYSVDGNDDGITKINNLELGLYFIKKNEYINKKYVTSPFIIPIPYAYESEIFYELRLDLKYEHCDSSIPTPPNTGVVSKSKNDDINHSYFLLLLFLLIVFYININENEKNKITTKSDKLH